MRKIIALPFIKITYLVDLQALSQKERACFSMLDTLESRLCVITSGSFAHKHFQFYNIYDAFIFTFWTEQGEFY